MFYRKVTFARVRMLVLTCLMLLALFGQMGVERRAQCDNCADRVCPIPVFPPQFPFPCVLEQVDPRFPNVQVCRCRGNGRVERCWEAE
jgi:hypothetical protein